MDGSGLERPAAFAAYDCARRNGELRLLPAPAHERRNCARGVKEKTGERLLRGNERLAETIGAERERERNRKAHGDHGGGACASSATCASKGTWVGVLATACGADDDSHRRRRGG